MVEGSVTITGWKETNIRMKKIKSLSKKMKIAISDVKIEQLADKTAYNRRGKTVKLEQFKITWSYTL